MSGKNRGRRAATDLVLTSAASINANLFTHPLETIKVRQMMHGGWAWQVGMKMVRTEGASSLYKGLGAACVRAVISGGGRLTGYHALKQYAIDNSFLSPEPVVSEMPIRGLLAVTAACLAQWAAAPVDLVRTRQAAHKGSATPSIATVIRQVYTSDGIFGLFAGSSAMLGRAATFNLGQLLTYDKCKYEAARILGRDESHVLTHTLAAAGAGVAATTACCPFENLKTHKQLNVNSTLLQSVKHIYSNGGGAFAFFRGWTPLYLKIAPHTLIVFVTLEFLRNQATKFNIL